jgi:hypothetical protein
MSLRHQAREAGAQVLAEMFEESAKKLRKAEDLVVKVNLLDDKADGLYKEEMKLFEQGEELFEAAKRLKQDSQYSRQRRLEST